MIEVFTTNIQSEIQAIRVLEILEKNFHELKINFDLNETNLPYPCGHTILRIEGKVINTEKVLSIVNKSGFRCDILEDKICN
ncbi:hypothetical protein SAMN02927937_02459 [Paenimyroides aquimaris]|uniref:Uncharacterized protein n=2 Tax=Paenimyroides marinum TaxID=1159016 RepID=A0A1H6MHC2_9FLAO|nr:hypothetical protein SAMN02927937_02459 [Paenimyroides aquimaris]